MDYYEMSPAQSVRINFWLPILVGIASFALTAGMAYGIMGADVAQNAEDIADLRSKEGVITEVRIAQGAAKSERKELQRGLDAIRKILDRRWAPTSGK